MYSVNAIKVSIEVDSTVPGLTGHWYLAIGGREFYMGAGLDSYGNPTSNLNRIVTIIFSAGSQSHPWTDLNIPYMLRSDQYVNPLEYYIIREKDLDSFPVYIRQAQSENDFTTAVPPIILEEVEVVVNLVSNDVSDITELKRTYKNLEDIKNIPIGGRAGKHLYLHKVPSKEIIGMITVSVYTKEDTGSRVWLGIGGREFFLETTNDDFSPDHSEQLFIMKNWTTDGGVLPNVTNHYDPNNLEFNPQYNYSDPGVSSFPLMEFALDLFPVYIRFRQAPGQDTSWEIGFHNLNNQPSPYGRRTSVEVTAHRIIDGKWVPIRQYRTLYPDDAESTEEHHFTLRNPRGEILYLLRRYDIRHVNLSIPHKIEF